MVDFSIADKIYLGDIEVSKLYKGGVLLYQKKDTPTGGNLYVENGNLVLGQGLIIDLQDMESGSTVAYTLPENVSFTGTNFAYNTLSDGSMVQFSPYMQGTTSEYQSGLDCKITYSGKLTVSGNVSYLKVTGQGITSVNSYTYGKDLTADIFGFYCTKDCNYLSIQISGFYGGNTVAGTLGVSGIYLHDEGEKTIDKVGSLFLTYASGLGKKDPNDISLNFSTGYGTDGNIYLNRDGLLKSGHSYSVYMIGKSSETRTGASPTMSVGGAYQSTFANVTIRNDIPFDMYDQDAPIAIEGYAYPTYGNNIRVSAGMDTYGTIIGTAKYNPTNGWYEATPTN